MKKFGRCGANNVGQTEDETVKGDVLFMPLCTSRGHKMLSWLSLLAVVRSVSSPPSANSGAQAETRSRGTVHSKMWRKTGEKSRKRMNTNQVKDDGMMERKMVESSSKQSEKEDGKFCFLEKCRAEEAMNKPNKSGALPTGP